MIAITFALPTESSDLLRRLDQRKDEIVDQLTIIRGRLGDSDLAILHTGVGQKHCAPRIDRFLAAIRPTLLISSGFAGSLTDRLNVGDLIIANNFSDAGLSQKLAPPSQTRIHHVRLATVASILNSAEQRAQLAGEMGVDAIDMETEIIAAASRTHGVPMISLRVISDSPAALFPAPPEILFDVVRQKTNFGRLIPYLLAHPAAAIRLYRFAAQISSARTSLTNALIDLVRNNPFQSISSGP